MESLRIILVGAIIGTLLAVVLWVWERREGVRRKATADLNAIAEGLVPRGGTVRTVLSTLLSMPLPVAVLAGALLIALALVLPSIFPVVFAEDVGTKARRDCEAFVRELYAERPVSYRNRQIESCMMHKAGVGG